MAFGLEHGQGLVEGVDRLGHVPGVVRHGDDHPPGEVHPPQLHRRAQEVGEALVLPPGRLQGEVDQRDITSGVALHPVPAQDVVHPGLDLVGGRRGLLLHAGIPDDLQAGHAGRGGEGVGVERAGVVDAPEARPLRVVVPDVEEGEDLPAGGHGGPVEAPGQDLGQGGHVRGHPVVLLGPAGGVAEAGDHLVEDQDDPVAPGDVPHRLQVLRARPAGDEDHPGHVAALFDQALDGLGVAAGAARMVPATSAGTPLERGTS